MEGLREFSKGVRKFSHDVQELKEQLDDVQKRVAELMEYSRKRDEEEEIYKNRRALALEVEAYILETLGGKWPKKIGKYRLHPIIDILRQYRRGNVNSDECSILAGYTSILYIGVPFDDALFMFIHDLDDLKHGRTYTPTFEEDLIKLVRKHG